MDSHWCGTGRMLGFWYVEMRGVRCVKEMYTLRNSEGVILPKWKNSNTKEWSLIIRLAVS
jgi:hypothetical protein